MFNLIFKLNPFKINKFTLSFKSYLYLIFNPNFNFGLFELMIKIKLDFKTISFVITKLVIIFKMVKMNFTTFEFNLINFKYLLIISFIN